MTALDICYRWNHRSKDGLRMARCSDNLYIFGCCNRQWLDSLEVWVGRSICSTPGGRAHSTYDQRFFRCETMPALHKLFVFCSDRLDIWIYRHIPTPDLASMEVWALTLRERPYFNFIFWMIFHDFSPKGVRLRNIVVYMCLVCFDHTFFGFLNLLQRSLL